MAEKYWDHLKLKNGDTVRFVPPSPNGDKLGGISATEKAKISSLQSSKQDKLVSATNIKTVNGQSILGAGNLTVAGGSSVKQDPNDPTGGVVSPATSAEIDKTLSLDNHAADAKVTGEKISALQGDVNILKSQMQSLQNIITSSGVTLTCSSGTQWTISTDNDGAIITTKKVTQNG